MDIFMRSLEVAAYIIASCSVILKTVSSMTKNTTDDAIARWWFKWPMKALEFFSLKPKNLPPA